MGAGRARKVFYARPSGGITAGWGAGRRRGLSDISPGAQKPRARRCRARIRSAACPGPLT